jgi:nucleotide-binding universal stress UspA family protein
MDTRFLVGIDTDFSPTTIHTLRTIGKFVEELAPHVSLVLLHVIPVTDTLSSYPSLHFGHLVPSPLPAWQKTHAEEILHKARLLLQQYSIGAEQVEVMVRVGIPTDEMLKIAQEQHVSLIVIGNRGNDWPQRLRRFFFGSLSHTLLRLAECPVMVIAPPAPMRGSGSLVHWYEQSITRYLKEHPDSLAVFTPQDVTKRFPPIRKAQIATLETAAASRALEQLADKGLLCRHYIKDKICYVND